MNKRKLRFSGLLNGTFLYLIGMSFSKLMSFIILPYISVRINAEEFGVFDTIQTISGLLVPVVSVQLMDSAFRFVYGKKQSEQEVVISNVWICLGLGMTVYIIFSILINIFCFNWKYMSILVIYTVSTIFLYMYQRVARSFGRRELFACAGVMQTAIMLFAQCIFVSLTPLGATGLIYAYAISCFVASGYVEVRIGALRCCKVSDWDWNIVKELIRFSAPLVPNSISWWGVSSFCRLVIIGWLGYAAAGIFSMANKFAGLLTSITGTFLLALQEELLKKLETGSVHHFLPRVFNVYVIILSALTSLVTLLQLAYFTIFIDPQYKESILLIPPVMLGMFFSSLCSFYGTGYFLYKKTKESFKSTLFGSVVSVVLSVSMVPFLGLMGAAIATLGGYLFLCLYRHMSMKEYFDVQIKASSVMISFIVLCVTTFAYYNGSIWFIIVSVIVVMLLLIVYFRIFLRNR